MLSKIYRKFTIIIPLLILGFLITVHLERIVGGSEKKIKADKRLGTKYSSLLKACSQEKT